MALSSLRIAVPSLLLPVLLVLVLLAPASHAAPNFKSWLYDKILPQQGARTPTDEIKCYGLPYGIIGFASHVVIYWVVYWLARDRRPLSPFGHHFEIRFRKWEMFVAVVGIAVCVPLAAFVMVRCRDRWEFVVVAFWNMMKSLTVASVTMHRAVRSRTKTQYDYPDREEDEGGLFVWLILYAVGTMVGLPGIVSLAVAIFPSSDKARIVTYVFAGLAGVTGLVGLAVGAVKASHRRCGGCATVALAVFGFLVGFGMSVVFYSDLLLAVIAGHWSGIPSRDILWLYVAYLIAKGLPLLVF